MFYFFCFLIQQYHQFSILGVLREAKSQKDRIICQTLFVYELGEKKTNKNSAFRDIRPFEPFDLLRYSAFRGIRPFENSGTSQISNLKNIYI